MIVGCYCVDVNSDSKEFEFVEVMVIYGLNNIFMLYGGLFGFEDYYVLGIGIGGIFGVLGVLLMDINRVDI